MNLQISFLYETILQDVQYQLTYDTYQILFGKLVNKTILQTSECELKTKVHVACSFLMSLYQETCQH
jgi:hypothetical protein